MIFLSLIIILKLLNGFPPTNGADIHINIPVNLAGTKLKISSTLAGKILYIYIHHLNIQA